MNRKRQLKMSPANLTGLESNKSIDCAVNFIRIGIHEFFLQISAFGMVRVRFFAAGVCMRRLFIVTKPALLLKQA
jgi:hypothetical protein